MRRNLKRKPTTVTSSNAGEQSANPWELVQKHSRYLSDFSSDIIEINVSHSLKGSLEAKTYNVSELRIGRWGHVSTDGSGHYKLSDYPDLLVALKAAINSLLFKRKEKIDDCVVNLINFTLRLYCWMIKNNIFKMSQLTKTDVAILSSEWSIGGWWTALDTASSLEKVMDAAKSSATVREQLSGKNNSKYFTVNADAISMMTGIPLSASYLPQEYAASLAEMLGVTNLYPNRAKREIQVTYIIYLRLLSNLNHFATFPSELGGLSFKPFVRPAKIAEKKFSLPGGRTKNISIENVVRITSQALVWVVEYKPVIEWLASVGRNALEIHINTKAVSERNIKNAVLNAYSAHLAAGGIKIAGLTQMTRASLANCIDALQTACYCLIAINHGRRKEELVGNKLPYGLYFDCLREISSIYEDWRVDIYVEKSVRNYVSFWCNDLVRKAILALESISQMFRPLNTEPKRYYDDRKNGRHDKLFCSRFFSKIGFSSEPEGFDFANRAAWFFELAQVDSEYFREKTQPFRRVFACLYMYRYDMPKPAALQQALRQDDASVTEVYYTDAPGTSPADGVKAVYAGGYDKELIALEAVIEEVRTEYFGDLILRMLKGEVIGGNFPKLVLKLTHRLSGSVKFSALDLQSKAAQISGKLERDGYSISPKEHGGCCATQSSKTIGRSNCAVDGQIHPENAGPEMCGGCLHLITTQNYWAALSEPLHDLRQKSRDFKLPAAERLRIKSDADELEAYIDADKQVAEENQKVISQLTEKWSKIVVRKGV